MGCLGYTLIALVIVIALSIALELFLSEYLLYHYDHDEPFDESEAAQVGVRRETIMRLEKAQYNPSLKLAIDIARVVEAPIEEIFVFK